MLNATISSHPVNQSYLECHSRKPLCVVKDHVFFDEPLFRKNGPDRNKSAGGENMHYNF